MLDENNEEKEIGIIIILVFENDDKKPFVGYAFKL